MTEIVLVAAMARDRVIGRAGGMPWHLPADLKHFKAVTSGHPVVMGRRTYESIGRPLPNRLNIVVSRSAPSLPEDVLVASSLDEAIERADADRVMVIGGGEIYRQALPRADRLELTLIDAVIPGDTRFPDFSGGGWRLASMQARAADERNPYKLVFCSLVRGYSRQQ
jgi:dihydrofolate reductase